MGRRTGCACKLHCTNGTRLARGLTCLYVFAIEPPQVHENVDRPDAWIDPMVSIVFEIKAAELQPSTDFKCGFTLRFPRVKCLRPDKGPADATTIQSIRELQQLRKGKMTGAARQLSGSSQTTSGSFSVDTFSASGGTFSQDNSSMLGGDGSLTGAQTGMKRRRVVRNVGQGLAPHLALVAQCAKMVPTSNILQHYMLKFVFPKKALGKKVTDTVHELASANESVMQVILPSADTSASSSSASLSAFSAASSASLSAASSASLAYSVGASLYTSSAGLQGSSDNRVSQLSKIAPQHILAALARDMGAEITSVLPKRNATIAGANTFDPDQYRAVVVVANSLRDVAKQVIDRDYSIDIVKPEWLVVLHFPQTCIDPLSCPCV